MESEVFYPQTLSELLDIISQNKVTIYAGGTDLMVEKRKGKSVPADINLPIVHIKDIEQLNTIEIKDEFIEIGACCSYTNLLSSQYIPDILKDAIKTIGGPAVRNFGTIGGNICNASPAADCVPVLAVLDAILTIESKNGKRETNLYDFILGRKKVDLKEGEVLTKIKIPYKYLENIKYYKFEKIGLRNAMTLSKVSVAVIAEKKIQIAFGAVAPKFVRIIGNEQILSRKKIKFDQFVKLYKPYFSAIDDQRSTKEYREDTACMIGYKLYIEAFEKIKYKS
ncbi:MAG: FAD binding domain-containing protein [Spirochaetota bacterium]